MSVLKTKPARADVTTTIWAAAHLRRSPPTSWLDSWFRHTLPSLRAGRFGAQNLANALWGLARLEADPPEEWLEAFWPASRAQLRESTPQHLSNLLWAAAKLQVVPPARWTRALWAEWRRQMHALPGSLGAQHLSSTLYACAACRLLPPPDVLALLWEAVEAELHTFSAQGARTERVRARSLPLRRLLRRSQLLSPMTHPVVVLRCPRTPRPPQR